MGAQQIELREYEHRLVDLDEATTRRLRAAAPGKLQILPGLQPGQVELVATQHVGTIVLPDIEVLIRPKVHAANLFWMLEAGGSPVDLGEDTFGYATHTSLLAAFATFFARVVETTTTRGLLRSYVEVHDHLPVLRGRVDVAAQMRRPALLTPLACQFDELTADNFENRLLKAAVRRLTMVAGVPLATRRRLLRALAAFEDVSDEWPDPERVERLHFHRLNRHYEPGLRLARLVLRNTSLADQYGQAGASTFLLDMNEVFEKFVEHRLRRALQGRLLVEGQATGLRLDRDRRVTIRPDLVFRSPRGLTRYVGDTKYKLTDNGLGRESDYYQLLAYTAALDLPEGVLIYFQHDGALPPDEIVVSQVGKRLRTFALDLAGDLNDVERAIEDLADWVAERSLRGRAA